MSNAAGRDAPRGNYGANHAAGTLGFETRWRPLVRAVLLLACPGLVACSSPAPAGDRVPVEGSALFAQACAKCHGSDGQGGLPTVADGPRPVDLTDAAWQRTRSDAELIATIRDGRGAMPPFADVLSDVQIHALAAHVRALARPSPPAVKGDGVQQSVAGAGR